MTISISLYLGGGKYEIKTYRGVARHNYSSYVAGFFANKDFYRYGQMVQLKGKERIVLHTFGKKGDV